MKNVCFYFQVHQPYRMNKYTVFDIGKDKGYFNIKENRKIMQKVAKKCYVPTNNLMLKLIDENKGNFRVSYSITGNALEQFEKYSPEVLDSFKKLAKTGCVEFLSETYHHSLSFLYSKEEFREQVLMHKKKIKELFGQEPTVFRNTELIFNNELANFIQHMGYKAIIAEGADQVLGWRSPNYVYTPKTAENIKLLLKNYKLSDDIAFRFSNRSWEEWPLTVEKYADWIAKAEGETVNLFMDYETFGEHQWEDTGIFNFFNSLPQALLDKNIQFRTPSEIALLNPVAELDIHNPVSWADVERDLSAWRGNKMQNTALAEIYAFEKIVKDNGDRKLLSDWRRLQTSDHFYYMCTKWFEDGDVHKYFNPYDSPYDSYISYMNILNDIAHRLKNTTEKPNISEHPSMLLNI
ncbi:MAG: glycoside hydrolase family 57 protein [Nanoarchaeota archaeon]|nr:glycoside hydrolase family 57 protein [Nanoarchaeota archaeon]